MRSRMVTICLALAAFAFASGAWAAEAAGAGKVEADPAKVESGKETTAPAQSKVTVEVKDAKVRDVLDSLAKQSREKFVIETTVKGTVAALSLKDVPLESALGTVCKSVKIEWRRIYISPDSKLLEQPDRLAATVRLMSGLSFPDIVLAGASTNRLGVHFEDKKAVTDAEESATKSLGMTKIYLITNDAAVAANALAKEKTEQDLKVDKFAQYSKDQMDMFMQMTPEEREQALVSNLNMMDQVGPEYMAAVFETLGSIDPENLRRLVAKQTEMLFNMSTEQRRSMMRLNMEAVKMITPEQQKLLQEDAMAIMKEMQADQGKTGN